MYFYVVGNINIYIYIIYINVYIFWYLPYVYDIKVYQQLKGIY